MDNKEIITKLRSTELCLTAHPDFIKGSEFEDRVFDLQEIIKALTLTDVSQQRELLINYHMNTLFDQKSEENRKFAEVAIDVYLSSL